MSNEEIQESTGSNDGDTKRVPLVIHTPEGLKREIGIAEIQIVNGEFRGVSGTIIDPEFQYMMFPDYKNMFSIRMHSIDEAGIVPVGYRPVIKEVNIDDVEIIDTKETKN